ncbi:MerC domain-containing protein [Gemmatimonas phototrophica]|uniref:MerC domain-containing protein n=1 Tax=Gemmatimonas phototrophica TaxID=1379270 RepID=UPI0006A6C1AD|nr:MerC domain-containing protein [Gemmatimonas phototrophica]
MCSPVAPERSALTMPWLDRLGMATSTLCAIHCAATALLMGALSAMGAAGLAAGWVEGAFLTVALVLGLVSLGHAVRRHRSWQPAAWFAGGMVLLLVVRPLAPSPALEVLAVVAGAFCVVRAHWKNARLLLA